MKFIVLLTLVAVALLAAGDISVRKYVLPV